MIERSYPGSAPDGTDLEYTPRPERVICAADEHYATRAEVAELRAHLRIVDGALAAIINAIVMAGINIPEPRECHQ